MDFNQGLIFLNQKQILEKIPAALEWVDKLNKISSEAEISVLRLAIGFVASIEVINSLVLGVESEEQLIDNKECAEYKLEKAIVEIISEQFIGIPQRVFDPRLWSANN